MIISLLILILVGILFGADAVADILKFLFNAAVIIGFLFALIFTAGLLSSIN